MSNLLATNPAYLLLPLLLVLTGFREPGGPDNNNYGCAYNGKILENGPPQNPNFTGTVICKENQKVTRKLTLKDGKRHGLVQEYASNGKLILDLVYKEGQLDGVQRSWDEAGSMLLEELGYKSGQPHGVQKKYFSSNGKLETIEFIAGSGGDATRMRFSESGKLIELDCGSQSLISEDNEWCGRNGKPSRVKTYGYKDRVDSEIGFLNNLKEGDWITYRDGKPERVVTYNKGKITATKKEENSVESAKEAQFNGKERILKTYFKESKSLQEVKTYSEETLTSQVEYYQNGKVKYQWERSGDDANVVRFDDRGRKRETRGERFNPKSKRFETHGKRVLYLETGEIQEEESFNLGMQEGLQKYQDFKRKRTLEAIYKQDRVSKRTLKDSSGKILGWEEYFPDGSIKGSEGSINLD